MSWRLGLFPPFSTPALSYLLALDTHTLSCQIVHGKDEPPVEGGLPSQGVVVDICRLSILLEPKEPPGDRVLLPGVPVCGRHPPDTSGSRGVPLGTGRLQQGNNPGARWPSGALLPACLTLSHRYHSFSLC